MLKLFLLLTYALYAKDHLSVAEIKPVELAAGKGGVAVLALTVEEGMHVQANPAATDPKLVPTTLDVTPNAALEIDKPIYPDGTPYKVKMLKKEIPVYHGKFEIHLPLKIKSGAKAGKGELVGTIRYQPCNDTNCFFPTKLPVKIPYVIR